jgi:hypothetical protein
VLGGLLQRCSNYLGMHAPHIELSGGFRVFAAGQVNCAFTCQGMPGCCCPIAMLQEVEKLQWATMWGADTMMDLRCSPSRPPKCSPTCVSV